MKNFYNRENNMNIKKTDCILLYKWLKFADYSLFYFRVYRRDN